MPFQILYFRDSVLEHCEVADAEDVVDAIKQASSQAKDLTAEVWTPDRKVAVIRPANGHRL